MNRRRPVADEGARSHGGHITGGASAAGAEAIGDRLVRGAIWYGDRCNWIGRSADEANEANAPMAAATAALDGDLYGGSAGCGLFLAVLAAHSGGAAHRRTAIGALRRSLDVADRLEPVGLFSGRVGVAYAAVVGGRALDDDTLVAHGRALAAGAVAHALVVPPGEEPLDLVGGFAGTVLALLALARPEAAADGALRDDACTLAARLAARGERPDGIWRWQEGDEPPLTAMSHGAAGIGAALLEAYAACGEPRLRVAAAAAFGQENVDYDPEQQNWRDLRAWASAAEGTPAPCGTTWCHGAPGIALARLRAVSVEPSETAWREDADRAIATTMRALESAAGRAGGDDTPCHGTTGLLETLLAAKLAGRATADTETKRAARTRAIAEAWTKADGTCGIPSGGTNPSLMVGAAGVGWYLLRALDPAGVPSVLGTLVSDAAPR